MESLKEKIYHNSPHFFQNLIITLFNILAYNKRYSTKYKSFISHYKKNNTLTKEELQEEQSQKYKAFIKHTISNSAYYKNQFQNIENPEDISNIEKLPIIDKETLRKNIRDIYTINKKDGIISKTGGTTGKSLEVLFTKDDIEERFAILDNFRSQFGYKLGKRTAWFSGKNLLNDIDLKKNRFWKTDYYYKVKYYSTFHIHNKFLKHYVKDLIKFKPEYLVGFPSTIYEIAKYGLNNNIEFPDNTIKAVFPTAETITDEIRTTIETFFKTGLYNQYASSEGAPFIIECKNKKLHLELQSGVYEVLANNNEKATKGRLIVTPFNTYGTPLVRYDIGDQIELSDDTCNCGNNNPVINEILGRSTDYIFSKEKGKVNLGNISNCLKGVSGIIKFQIQQKEIEKILVLIEKDDNVYNKKYEALFIKNLKERLGSNVSINIRHEKEIAVEKSGKFRLVKNSLKIEDCTN